MMGRAGNDSSAIVKETLDNGGMLREIERPAGMSELMRDREKAYDDSFKNPGVV